MNTPEILVIARERFDPANPGRNTRPYHIALMLDAAGFEVTLAVPNPETLPEARFRVTTSEKKTLRGLLKRSSVVVSSGREYPVQWQMNLKALQVFDLVDSMDEINNGALDQQVLHLLHCGDMILCGNPYQRDVLLGAASGLGRFSDPQWRTRNPLELFASVPYGHPGDLPALKQPRLRGVVPGINPKDRVVLWHGPMDVVADPETAIAGIALLEARHPEIKLVFATPKADAAAQNPVYKRTYDYACAAGMAGKSVFFVDLDDRDHGPLLREADATVCCLREGTGNRFWSARHAIESVWAQTPLVLSRGNYMATLVDSLRIGLSASPYDELAVADRLVNICERGARTTFFENLQTMHQHFAWDRAVQPLIHALENPPEQAAPRGKPHRNWAARVRLAMANLFA